MLIYKDSTLPITYVQVYEYTDTTNRTKMMK